MVRPINFVEKSEYSSSEQIKREPANANHIGHHVLMNNISKHDMSTINNWILVYKGEQ